jgi:hypothetical protein
MSIALVQSTTSAHFAAATGAGNLLLCVVYAAINPTVTGTLTFSLPTTTGSAWTLADDAQYTFEQTTSDYLIAGAAVYFIENAASMADTTTTSVSVTSGAGAVTVSFSLYEFSGVAKTSALDDTAQNDNVSGTVSAINAGSLTTTATDLIFATCTYVSATHGTGFTAGVTVHDQYILNKVSGTVATAFASSEGVWAAVAASFKTGFISASASPSGVHATSAVGTATTFTIAYALPTGASLASAVGIATTMADGYISVVGVTMVSAVGVENTLGSAEAFPSSLSMSIAVGTALPGGAPASVSPLGVSMLIAVGAIAAGVPINYGNVVAGSSGLPSGINSTYFYARWTGWLTLNGNFGGGGPHGGGGGSSGGDIPGIYTLGLNIADGGDFYLGSRFIVNALGATQTANSTSTYTQSLSVELAANIPYPIVIEWQHGAGANYECQLLWTPPNTTTPVVIPTANISLTGKWWNGTSSGWFPTTWY